MIFPIKKCALTTCRAGFTLTLGNDAFGHCGLALCINSTTGEAGLHVRLKKPHLPFQIPKNMPERYQAGLTLRLVKLSVTPDLILPTQGADVELD